jgi:hypothetical protein
LISISVSLKYRVSVTLLLCLVFCACKKKQATEAENTPADPGPSASPCASGLPSSTDSIYGVLQVGRIFASQISIDQPRAVFSKVPKKLSSYTPYTDELKGFDSVQAVSVNQVPLSYNTSLHDYRANASVTKFDALTWDVKGNSNFPSFLASVSRGLPNITNTDFLPHSFSKTAALNISFGTSLANADSVQLTFYSNTGNLELSRAVPLSAGSVSFAVQELVEAVPGETVMAIVELKNYSYLKVSGKTFIFRMYGGTTVNGLEVKP